MANRKKFHLRITRNYKSTKKKKKEEKWNYEIYKLLLSS